MGSKDFWKINGFIFTLICFNFLIFSCSANTLKNNTEEDSQNRPRRHLFPTTVYTYIKHRYRTSKSGPWNRGSGHSVVKPRILSNGPPVKLVHNGPFYLNHHIYYDSSTHGLPQQEEVSFLNTAPKIKISDTNNHHADFLNVDLSQNQHIDKFEVNLPSFTVSEPNSFHNEIVKPLVQGGISIDNSFRGNDHGLPIENYGFAKPTSLDLSAENHQKYNEKLDAIVDYLKESGEASVFGKEKPAYYENKEKTNFRGEFVSTPNLMKHPLEHDPSKSTYDTPGAVDSYGHPVTENSKPPLYDAFEHQAPQSHSSLLFNRFNKEGFENSNEHHNFDNAEQYNFQNFGSSEYSNNFKNSFESLDKNVNLSDDFKQYIQYQLNNDIERLKRSNKVKENVETDKTTTVKYSNHKYD